MSKKFFYINILVGILVLISNKDSPSLEIHRSRSHIDQTKNLTPLVVTLSTEDKSEKMKDVDLICIVDVSGSMSGNKIQLVRESLKSLVNYMTEKDNLALITFSDYVEKITEFTQMTPENKTLLLEDIDELYASGGTRIYPALETAVRMLKDNYSSGERIASIIFLSDGQDIYEKSQVVPKFKKLISNRTLSNYTFTLHTFGYGNDHDPNLLLELAKAKGGGFFFIKQLSDVQDAYLYIFGSLSTVYDVNLNLTIQSNFKIEKVYGMEDMYQASLSNNTKVYSFNTVIIQVIYGKRYAYVVLVDIPPDTPYGTEVLNATISPLNISAKYLWDQKYNVIAYEEYIRCISVTYFSDAFYAGKTQGIVIIKEGRAWIEVNYNGTRNWIVEYDDAINDLNNYNSFGKANLLSKIYELKTSTAGIHYNMDNSYARSIIDKSHNIDVSKLPSLRVIGQKIIDFDLNINYYYFYLKEGNGKINNFLFSGEGSSLIIYSDNSSSKINITSLSDYIEYYYWNETKFRIQNIIDFSHGGKFIIEKDLPFEFYTRVDGSKDIAFNIEFLKLENNDTSNTSNHQFDIVAYVLDEKQINNLANNSLPTTTVYNGSYDSELSLGKIVIKKEEISKYKVSNSLYNNYLYVIVKKNAFAPNIVYKHIEGQFIFVSMDYIFSTIPEGFYISSNLSENQKTPHLYTLEGKNMTIEFSSSGDELICKVLKYQNYPTGSEELYVDNNQFNIQRREDKNKTYIDVIQDNQEKDENSTSDKIILSIFSKNEGHTASTNISKLSYTLKYLNHPYVYNNNTNTNNTNNTNTNNTNSTEPIVRPKADVILLGFAKYIYIRTIKITYFSAYFAHVKQIVYTEILIITVNIRYKIGLRRLQENETKQATCKLINNSGYENQDRYNCTLETNGEVIDNIQVSKFNFTGQEVEIVGKTPFAEQYINNLQNIGNGEMFNKKFYILNNSTTNIDNNNNEFNITGTINDKSFNYRNLTLTLNSKESKEKTENIPCKVIDLNNEKYILKCNTDNELKANLDGAFANLGDENLIVNFVNKENSTVDFDSKVIYFNNNNNNNKKKGLSTGGIVGIIIACVAVLIIATIVTILIKGRKNVDSLPQNSNMEKDVASSTQL